MEEFENPNQENQNWESELSEWVTNLSSERADALAVELEQLRTDLNESCARLTALARTPFTESHVAAMAEEIRKRMTDAEAALNAEFHQRIDQACQDVEQDFQAGLEQAREEARAEARKESEEEIARLHEELEERQQELAVATAAAAAAAAAPPPVETPDVPATQDNSLENLKAAIEEIDAQRTQAQALTSLVEHASRLAPRVVFFVVKSGEAVGWKARGFDNGLDDETVRSLSAPAQASNLVGAALASWRTAADDAEDATLLGRFSSPAASHAVAIPLVVRVLHGAPKAAAVLYADSGSGSESALNLAGLEMLVRVAAMAVELQPTRREADSAARTAAPAVPAPAPTAVPEAPTADVHADRSL
jgi:hypothetical protein